MEIKEVNAVRALNPTAIDLAEYVINPYKGCAYGCLYCYVRSNKTVVKDPRPWGEYLEARVNLPDLLEKELCLKKPEKVLLGSTTECFGPYEEEFRITERVLEILHRHKVRYTIMTRSPYVGRHMELLKQGLCDNIYFTANTLEKRFKDIFEGKSPDYGERRLAINELLKNDIPVTVYISPVLPFISDIGAAFAFFPEARNLEFEALNFNLGNIDEIVRAVTAVDNAIGERYGRMKRDEDFYIKTWKEISAEVMAHAAGYNVKTRLHVHDRDGYFNNRY